MTTYPQIVWYLSAAILLELLFQSTFIQYTMQNSLNYSHSKIFVAVMVIFVLQGKKQFHNKQMKVKKKEKFNAVQLHDYHSR